MNRIPLRPIGPTAPDYVVQTLASFGNNPYGEPLFRLIWSEAKMIYFAGEECPEYLYLNPPAWVLETWISPEKDSGGPEQWKATTFGLFGEYPSHGTYNYVQHFPSDWYPSEESVRLLCEGLRASKDISMKDRVDAIRANKEAEAAAARQKVADEIVELQDSGSRGLVQQAVSGPKTNFRNVDDYLRDIERGTVIDPTLPRSGGKILRS